MEREGAIWDSFSQGCLFAATTRPDFDRYLGPGPCPAAGSLLTCSPKYYPAHSYVGLDKVQMGAVF